MVFEVDEELPDPVNQLNVSIDLVDDEDVEEWELFVATVELRNPCQIRDLRGQDDEHQLLIFSRQSTLVHIVDNDSKLFPLRCQYACVYYGWLKLEVTNMYAHFMVMSDHYSYEWRVKLIAT